MIDVNAVGEVLREVSEAFKENDAIGIVVSVGPIDYFIAKSDSGLPAKVVVALEQGNQVLGALYIKKKFFGGQSGRLECFQEYKNDENAKACLRRTLDEMLRTPAAGKNSGLLGFEVGAGLGPGAKRTSQDETLVRENLSSLGDLGGVDAEELSEELARRKTDREAMEAALNQPCHLYFYSAIDLDGVTRFFDLMDQGDEFSLAETALSSEKLGECVETVYRTAGGGKHHVHRLYGEVRESTAQLAMRGLAKRTGLTQVTEIAETRTPREAQPIWPLIFERLGCPSN